MRRIESWKQLCTGFVFAPAADAWLGVLRIGLGLQVILYCCSIGQDWNYLLASHGGLISRNLSETLLSLESPLVPRLGWLVTIGARFGVNEATVLTFVWFGLVAAGCLLILGIFSRTAAILGWLLHLGAVKSGNLVSYGMDNLTTIGLFYLMLSPLPDRFSLDWLWHKPAAQDRHLLGFWRRMLQIHLCLIYFYGGVAKCVSSDWWNGTNLWRALIRPPFDLLSADALIRFKHLFPIAGSVICLLEIGYPFFIWNRQLRRPWLIAIVAMHLGIGIAMGMYLFASIMLILNLAAFGPGILWPEKQPPELSRTLPVLGTPRN